MDRSYQLNRTHVLIIATLVSSLAYAIIRYVFFGDVPASQIPIYIFNKALALSTVVLIVSLCTSLLSRDDRKIVGATSLIMAVWHSILSIVILSPHYFPAFYQESFLSISGQATILLGLLSLTGCVVIHFRWVLWNRLLPGLTLIMIISHVALIGWESWFTPGDWNGGLIPISLISTCIGLIGMINIPYRNSKSTRIDSIYQEKDDNSFTVPPETKTSRQVT